MLNFFLLINQSDQLKAVLYVDETMMKSWINSNPHYDNSKIDIFGYERWVYPCLAFGLNSPLKRMFNKGAFLSRERGVENNLLRR